MELRKLRILIGLIVLFAGIDVTILTSHLSKWVGVAMIFIGLGILLSGKTQRAFILRIFQKKEEKEVVKKNLASKLLHFITVRGKLLSLFPIIGFCIVNIVILYNVILTGSIRLASFDYVTILLGVMFIIYNYIPAMFEKERDLGFLFFFLLFLILVIPMTIYSIRYGKIEEYTNSPVIYHLLARPLSGCLNLIGIPAIAYSSAEEGIIVRFALQQGGFEKIAIGLSCSGLYSVSVFISLFIAWTMTEFTSLNKKIGLTLTAGIVTSYIANLLRMTIIVVVGSYYGMEALLWTHANLGEIIFIIWLVLFWALIFKSGLTSESVTV